jgi:hypothetical protein
MKFAWHDLLGTVGVALVLWSYLALQLGRWRAEQLRYSVANGLGALLIVISLLYAFNLSAFVVEGFWVLISIVGVARWWRARAFVGAASAAKRLA